jgi:hypothetical protein
MNEKNISPWQDQILVFAYKFGVSEVTQGYLTPYIATLTINLLIVSSAIIIKET